MGPRSSLFCFATALSLSSLLLGCAAEDDERMLGPGGNNGNGRGVNPGSPDDPDPDPDATISGRLCVLDDLRFSDGCLTNGAAADIPVRILGGESTTTDTSGDFELTGLQADTALLVIGEGDAQFRTTVMRIFLSEGGVANLRPITFSIQTWEDLLLTAGVAEPGKSASLLTYVKDLQGFAVAGAEIAPPANTVGVPIYDGPSSPNDWNAGTVTGTGGASIVVGIPSGEDVTFDVIEGGSQRTIEDVPAQADLLTVEYVLAPSA